MGTDGTNNHDDVIKWKNFPRYWPFVRGIHRSPVDSAHKGKWCGALMFSLICAWTNGWSNNRDAGGDFRRHRAHYDVTVMIPYIRGYGSTREVPRHNKTQVANCAPYSHVALCGLPTDGDVDTILSSLEIAKKCKCIDLTRILSVVVRVINKSWPF